MKYILSLLIALLSFSFAYSQNSPKVKELQNQRKALIQQIAGINKQLKTIVQTSAQSEQKLHLIESKIASRKKLIDLLTAEVAELDNQIKTLQSEIAELEKELNLKKGEYCKSVQLMYMKRSSYEKMMFVLSANSFTQAYRRARYLKEYAVWSRLKGEQIKTKQAELNQKKIELQNNKSEKGTVLAMRQQETQNLQQEESKQQVVVSDLQKEQKKLQTTLAKQKKAAAALDRQIQTIIQEEIRKAQEEARRAARAEAERKKRLAAEEALRKAKAEEEARRKAFVAESARIAAAEKLAEDRKAREALKAEKKALEKKRVEEEKKQKKELEAAKAAAAAQPATQERTAETAGGYAMTKEEKALSSNFAQNRGSLPVPVTGRYTVVGHFGQQQHENLVHVVTNNNGVDIRTESGADARCVFKGVVTKVFVVPGYNSSVIVRHGNYLTVYSNLSRVYVKAGDQVGTKQAIGKIYFDAEEGNQAILHFQVWKEMTKQNPEGWVNF